MNVRRIESVMADPKLMGGKSCIRGMRVTAGNIMSLIASGL
jgi:uncharacterized protein (DUF433 family)